MSRINNGIMGEKSSNMVPHPCIHCEKPCFGSQCKECHLKMIAEREGDCIDCDTKFNALRKDGSMKKRCFECQKIYNKNHIAVCSSCNNTYHATLDDGRVFNKCFDCYRKSFHQCKNCDNTIKEEFDMCGDCFRKEKQKDWENKKVKSETSYPQQECRTNDCTNTTSYTYCKYCNDGIRTLENEYMISTCQEPGCGLRLKGNFKFCNDHRKKQY